MVLKFDEEGELDELDRLDVEYLFLTKTLGWKEGLNGAESMKNQVNSKCITEYLFATEQMGWKQGLKLLGEKGEDAMQKDLQQIHDIKIFSQNTGTNSLKKNLPNLSVHLAKQ